MVIVRRVMNFGGFRPRVRWSGSTDLAQTQRELDATIRSVLKAAPGTKHHLVGSLALQLQSERLMLRSFLIAIGVAAGIIALLSIVALRHFGAALVALLPTAAPDCSGSRWGKLVESATRSDGNARGQPRSGTIGRTHSADADHVSTGS